MLSELKTKLTDLLGPSSTTEIKATHTQYGLGVREVYPASESRDKLKNLSSQDEIDFNYEPVEFTAQVVVDSVWEFGKHPGKSWADPAHPSLRKEQIENGRKLPDTSWCQYETVDDMPINPMGKTGIIGRGELGLWGPNPAADPVVLRVKKLKNGEEQLQVLLIQRADGDKEFAIPGGMIDPTDSTVSAAALRELGEETGLKADTLALKNYMISIGEVYSGYVDDRRNTDNAWMVTKVYVWILKPDAPNQHNEISGKAADDEVINAKWHDVVPILKGKTLFAGHEKFIKVAVNIFNNFNFEGNNGSTACSIC